MRGSERLLVVMCCVFVVVVDIFPLSGTVFSPDSLCVYVYVVQPFTIFYLVSWALLPSRCTRWVWRRLMYVRSWREFCVCTPHMFSGILVQLFSCLLNVPAYHICPGGETGDGTGQLVPAGG